MCSGENLYLRHGFRDLLEQQAVDIIMPDIPKCGLSEVPQDRQHGRALPSLRRLASRRLARWRRPTSPPSPTSWCWNFIGCTATCWTTIIQEKTDIIKDGYIHLSDRPGIGVELDEVVGQQYQFEGTTWFA
ncbi:MAG: hypothetical protein R2873_22055 [Caldilineaceae bacterium]